MALNSLEFATNFTGELDKIITDKSAVGILADNALKAKFVGAKTVKIPNISLQGLGSYDRDNGFTKGTVNITNTAYTMTQDRSRSFNIDREDLDETGIASLAGEVLGEFVRTKVVPEIDAYTLSKLCQLAVQYENNFTDFDIEKPYEAFIDLADKVQAKVGMDEEIVCFMNRYFWNKLRKSDEFSKVLDITHMKKGEVSFEINKIDNIRIIPVSETRMRDAFDFETGSNNTAGGFTPVEGSSPAYMIMFPKKAVSLVKKSEKIRIFTPDQNIDCDAYKFDYRIYYDAFVKENYADSVYVILEPVMYFTKNLSATVAVQHGNSATLTAKAFSESNCVPKYQWYTCSNSSGDNADKIAGETSNSYELPDNLTNGNHYYFVKATCATKTITSNVSKVVVS